MTNVIEVKFNRKNDFKLDSSELINTRTFGFINDIRVTKPKSASEYQELLKQFLCQEDYEEVLICIMDSEYYNDAEKQIKKIVDSYFSFPIK